MENIITNDDRTAMAEVDYIIHHMNERYLNKIPQNVQDFIAILKKRNVKVYVDPHKPLENQGLKEFTLYFLMILNLKYWCDDARRREILLMLENNQKKYDEKINNIFNSAQAMQGEESESLDKSQNKTREAIVTGTPTFKNKKIEHNVEAPSPTEHIGKKVKKESNEIDELSKKTEAIVGLKTENIFVKFINKIKSFWIRK